MNVATAVTALGQVVGLSAPAAEKALQKAERRLGYAIPAGLRDFYLHADGTVDATPVENGWTRFWSVVEWRTVKSLGCGGLYSDVENAIVVADYSLESWYYAVDSGPAFSGTVYIVDGARPPRMVASSFADFVNMVVQDDEGLYPADRAG